MMNEITKITTKNICGPVSGFITKIKSDKKPLYNLIGLITAIKQVETQYGTNPCFHGRFEATNLHTAEVSGSSKAYMPQIVADQVTIGMEQSKDLTAKIAVEIGIIKDEKIPTGYRYTVKNLLKDNSTDALAELRKVLLPSPIVAKKIGKKITDK